MSGLSSDLTMDERATLESVELGEWQSVPNLTQAIERYQQYAQQQIQALEAVSVSLPADDLQALRKMAEHSDTPISVLMASVLHQYVVSHSSS
jgi:predicted DNA binding CopG/RHH family protein